MEQDRIAEVIVQSEGDPPRMGIHVAYRCVVRLTVRGCIPMSGTGYGDAVEYGGQAAATASELALKESESDALKRALKNYGDQFGLILYAKEAELNRIFQEETREGTAATVSEPIGSWRELYARFTAWGPDYDWGAILNDAVLGFFQHKGEIKDMEQEQRGKAFTRSKAALEWLWENTGSPDEMPPLMPEDIVRAFAAAFDGYALAVESTQPKTREWVAPGVAAPQEGDEPQAGAETPPEAETANGGDDTELELNAGETQDDEPETHEQLDAAAAEHAEADPA